MIKLSKLTEISPSGDSQGANIDPFDSMDKIIHRNGNGKSVKIKLTTANKRAIKKFKGYRFLIVKEGGGNNILFMLLPDKNFVVGAIEFYINQNFGNFKNVNQSHYSSTHKRFRGQGLGRIMYEYFVTKFKIVASDTTLYGGSFKIWSTLDKYFNGTLFVVGSSDDDDDYSDDSYSDVTYQLTGANEDDRESYIDQANNFVYVHKKINIPKNEETVVDEMLVAIRYEVEKKHKIDGAVRTSIPEVYFEKAMKNYNIDEDYPDFLEAVYDDRTIEHYGTYVVVAKDESYVYVIKHNFNWGNDILELEDIYKSKLKGINRL